MIKLVAIDIDDTLINANLRIPEENIRAIRKVIEAGVVVTFATGRMHVSALPFAKEIGFSSQLPLITYNGAMVRRVDGELIHHTPLHKELCIDIVKQSLENNWTINAYYDDRVYVNKYNHYIRQYETLARVEATEVKEFLDFVQDEEKEFSKLLIIDEAQEIAKRKEYLRDRYGKNAQIVNSKDIYIEITDPLATKGVALENLATKLGIDQSEVMAIGDSGNDISMLKFAGVAVAVANASAKVQSYASFVTTSNEECGVAVALQKYFPNLFGNCQI